MPEIERKIDELRRELFNHDHNGTAYRPIYFHNILGGVPSNVNVVSGTIATTGNTDIYMIAPIAGNMVSCDFSALDALAANDTNYITWLFANLGQDGNSATSMLSATNTNTTKATGGTAISANTVRSLLVNETYGNSLVAAGDRLRLRASVTGTLANTVTAPVYMLRFK
ncbi:MAG: hypothetical protein Q6360_13105 [Candidatus Brocadiales bacterium]|nr:hypothetical protein [Candidatus Brocadiales bacterium]